MYVICDRSKGWGAKEEVAKGIILIFSRLYANFLIGISSNIMMNVIQAKIHKGLWVILVSKQVH